LSCSATSLVHLCDEHSELDFQQHQHDISSRIAELSKQIMSKSNCSIDETVFDVEFDTEAQATELWSMVEKTNRVLLEQVNAAEQSEAKSKIEDEFKDWYLAQHTELLGTALDAVRQDPLFNGTENDIAKLIKIIEIGETLFDDDFMRIAVE